jgi:uncharacterized membrane protein
MKKTYEKENLAFPLSSHPAFANKLKNKRLIIKSFEAKLNSRRSFSEKIADIITTHLGSTAFLLMNALWFALWISINLKLIPGITPFDKFPFGLLTMIVSLEAIFLSVIVLISQNRATKIDDIREEIDLQINTMAEEEIKKMMELQVMILNKQGIDVSHDDELQRMLRPTDTDHIEEVLEKQLK